MTDQAQSDLYYLRDLLHCTDGSRMSSGQRGVQRIYFCQRCGRQVDAITLEVEIWERVTHNRPDIGVPGTPYPERHDILCRVLRAAHLRAQGTAFRLVRRPLAESGPRSAKETGAA